MRTFGFAALALKRQHWHRIRGLGVALRHDGSVRPQGMLTRKEAANLLGMNDTEFGLRLIWDSAFPKQIRGASVQPIFARGSRRSGATRL